jgi:hypothetical protein
VDINIDSDPSPGTAPGGVSDNVIRAAPTLLKSGALVVAHNFSIAPGQFRDFAVPYPLTGVEKVAISLNATGYNLHGTDNLMVNWVVE